MKKTSFYLMGCCFLFYCCTQNHEEITIKRFTSDESYNIINSIYNTSKYQDTIYLWSHPLNSNHDECTTICFPIFPLKYITFYNLDEFKDEDQFLSMSWDEKIFNSNIHLITEPIDPSSEINSYNDKLVYTISLPLRDKSGNFALIFEQIIYNNLYNISKYRIIKKSDDEWKLFYEIER